MCLCASAIKSDNKSSSSTTGQPIFCFPLVVLVCNNFWDKYPIHGWFVCLGPLRFDFNFAGKFEKKRGILFSFWFLFNIRKVLWCMECFQCTKIERKWWYYIHTHIYILQVYKDISKRLKKKKRNAVKLIGTEPSGFTKSNKK